MVLCDTAARGAAAPAMAGWHEYPPNAPKRIEQAQLYTWDATERMKLMDNYGIESQVLFPNILFFHTRKMLNLCRADLMLDAVRAFNDWQTDWSSAAPNRLLPQTLLPFWDLDETIKEIERCARMGHRGIVFTSEPEHFDQPKLTNTVWDHIWARAEEMGLPINFRPSSTRLRSKAAWAGFRPRFPHSTWQWANCGVAKEHAEYDLLPSEYFKRQIYASFWFERDTLTPAIEQLGGNNPG